MAKRKNDRLMRGAGRIYGRLRAQIAETVRWTQMGPASEDATEIYWPSRSWENHR
jgi:hypothetical protein